MKSKHNGPDGPVNSGVNPNHSGHQDFHRNGGGGDAALAAPVVASSRNGAGALTLDVIKRVTLTVQDNTVRVDWFTGTCPVGQHDKLATYVDEMLGEHTIEDHVPYPYRKKLVWESAKLRSADGVEHCSMVLEGKACARLSPEKLLAFFRFFYDELGGHATRLDIAYDDFTRELIKMDDVRESSTQVVGFRSIDPRRPSKMVKGKQVYTGDAVTFGRRGSKGGGSHVQFYDKCLESKGVVNSIRLEVRFSDDKAKDVFEALSSSLTVERFAAKLSRRVGKCIDFADRTGAHGHKARFKRLAWWQRVLDVLGEEKTTCKRPRPALVDSLLYIRSTFRRPIAKLVKEAGKTGHDGVEVVRLFFTKMIEEGARTVHLYKPSASLTVSDISVVLG